MKITTKIYDKNGLHYVEDVPPKGWVVVDIYHPCSTVTPWDYYGMCHQRKLGRVLTNAGLEFCLLVTTITIITPMGTGRKGAVRFGDNMTPGVYKVAVKSEDVDAANKAIVAHKQRVQDWLNGKAEFPEECRG